MPVLAAAGAAAAAGAGGSLFSYNRPELRERCCEKKNSQLCVKRILLIRNLIFSLSASFKERITSMTAKCDRLGVRSSSSIDYEGMILLQQNACIRFTSVMPTTMIVQNTGVCGLGVGRDL